MENWFKNYNIEDYLLPNQIKQMQDFPLWSKDKLASKIVDHYYMREIGLETPQLFKHYAKVKMQEIMEEKLPYIYTVALDYDPLVNVDFTETFDKISNENSENISNITNNNTQNITNNSNSKSNSKSSGLNINSDTPETNIDKDNILNGNYASNTSATENNSDITDETKNTSNVKNNSISNGNNNSTSNNTENYTRHFKGNQRNICNLSSYDKTI